MRGRKPLPSNLKVLRGNADAVGSISPPPRSQPTCPAHLSPTAKVEWKRLAQSMNAVGILTQADRATLAVYCQTYGRWVEAEKALKASPPLLKTPAGYVQQSPWIAIANKQAELMARYMAELGLTPSARSRLPVSLPAGPRPWHDDPHGLLAKPG